MSLHSSITGYDFTGHIISSPLYSPLTPVFGMTWPAPNRPLSSGAHQPTLIHSDPELLFLRPDYISEEQAAGLTSSLLTAIDGICNCLGFGFEEGKEGANKAVLIWGGGTNVGWAAIQVAKNVGKVQRIFVVCSESNFDKVREVGATDVFDYHAGGEEVVKQVRKRVEELNIELEGVLDCVGDGLGIFGNKKKECEETSTYFGGKCLDGAEKKKKGRLWCVLPVEQDSDWDFVLFSRKYGDGLKQWPGLWERQKKVFGWIVENYQEIGWKSMPRVRIVRGAEEAVKAVEDCFEGRLMGMEKVLIRHPMV
ncbi:hypothetical protein QBC38DRAFT_478005 [Podospora fimiseda]|uniref:Alcohol dehydrogenase-like C-terminal domain-containing protein n=1 Tax=Podospora fimiseda TaxID=252190 RepID=A0AAN7BQ28_9PEZI|nr:hypothetical protein QBC38DRAFT_478005 [Podospora fimiseda]